MADLEIDLNGGFMMNEERILDVVLKEGCTVLKVMLLVVDEFNATKREQKDHRPCLFMTAAAKNTATEIYSKYQRGIISVKQVYEEARSTGRRIYFQTAMGA